jgi:hypothetical protein
MSKKNKSEKTSKKVGKIIGITVGVLALLTLLAAVASFVFAHIAVQDFRRDATVQIKEFNETGRSNEVVKLNYILLGTIVNPQYSKLNDLQDEYGKLYTEFLDYYRDKDRYESEVSIYNDRVRAGEDVEGGDDLEAMLTDIKDREEKLNRDLKDLQEKLNNL